MNDSTDTRAPGRSSELHKTMPSAAPAVTLAETEVSVRDLRHR